MDWFIATGVVHASVTKLIKISRLDTILTIIPTVSESVDYVMMNEIGKGAGRRRIASMSVFEVTILGNNSAFPAHGRFPSSQILNCNQHLYLIDCGEGAQMRMSQYGIKRSRINHIFITHLHGDHVFGLPGLINSYTHFSRTTPLHIYGPKGIRQMIETTLRLSASMIQYEVVFHEIENPAYHKILDSQGLKVYTFPLQHRIPTHGYLFVRKEGERHMRKSAIEKYNLTIPQIQAAKAGDSIDLADGSTLQAEALTDPPSPARKYAYCSDTIFAPEIADWIRGVNLLYHEATFLHELEHKAEISRHSTAFQAGMIARLAEVEKLIIGHFSSRYDDLEPLAEEARDAFPDVRIATEGETFTI